MPGVKEQNNKHSPLQWTSSHAKDAHPIKPTRSLQSSRSSENLDENGESMAPFYDSVESLDEEDEMTIRPLELSDIGCFSKSMSDVNGLLDEDLPDYRPAPKIPTIRAYSEGSGAQKRKNATHAMQRKFNMPIVARWKSVVKRALSMEDPWSRFHISAYPTEECTRYRYHSIRKEWVKDTVFVKMQAESFAKGAMRECFRLKKLHPSASEDEWEHAQNYVAKRYFSDVSRETLFEDVRLQMDAKLWAEEYNRHNPPKKIDIFQVSILEFVDREDKPLYHLEHFIDGKYIKYNSNSGFVSDEWRQTPQAFSHFTFERSAHKMIVVDIQGVDDLYTDPQIHTVDGKGYGDGNLGTKGMALFFHSHTCNSICRSMELTEFDLAPTEKANIRKFLEHSKSLSGTVVRGMESLCRRVSSELNETDDIMDFIRQRSTSGGSELKFSVGSAMDTDDESDQDKENESEDETVTKRVVPLKDKEKDAESGDSGFISEDVMLCRRARNRFSSDAESAISSGDGTHEEREEEREKFWAEARKKSRPAGLMSELQLSQLQKIRHAEEEKRANELATLGQVHLDIARYHELGRFCEEGKSYDRAAAWCHLDLAAQCGLIEAILTAAKIHLNMPHDILVDFEVEDDENNLEVGLDFMEQAAEAGDRGAMLHMAQVYETGEKAGERERNWKEACKWYERAANTKEADEDGDFDSTLNWPKYQIYEKIATLHRTGGHSLDRDPATASEWYSSAAEDAMEAMKGKLANRYYMLAEECTGEVEEE